MESLHVTADAETLINRAAHFISLGRPGVARPLVAAARALAPPSPELCLIGARLAAASGASDRGLVELDQGIAAAPDHAGLRKCRANMRQRTGDLDGAARDAAEAMMLDPADPEAKAILGAVMLDLRRPAEAAACLAEALTSAPSNLDYRHALATAMEKGGDVDGALAILIDGIAISPTSVTMRNAAILLCIRRRDFNQAIRLGEEARSLGIVDASTFGMQGHALSSLGQHSQAASAYQEARKLGPEDEHVRHLVMSSGLMTNSVRAPEGYIRTVFDDYADRFEAHLIQLGYRIPGAIRTILQGHPKIAAGQSIGPVLDLGCGTGLVALVIGDLPLGPFTGVDLSPRMLAHARAKCLYGTLRESDIVSDLMHYEQRWPLIVAADVLCYFGALEDLLARVHQRLEPGGWFVFSVESIEPDHDGVVPGNGDWALQRQGRYVHAEHYVYEAVCNAGFRIVHMERPVIRQEADAGVPGLLLAIETVRRDS